MMIRTCLGDKAFESARNAIWWDIHMCTFGIHDLLLLLLVISIVTIPNGIAVGSKILLPHNTKKSCRLG